MCKGYLYHHWFQQVLGEENREAESVLEDALTAAMAVFDATASECWSQVVRVIVKECQVSLAHIRSITQTYRMTNKPAPVKHSAFVPSILHPLKEMLGGWGSMLSDEKRDKLVTAVGEQVSEAYRVKAGELLVAVRKLEKTLAKHRRRAVKRIAGTEADVSDADKMCLQLVLDVKEFLPQLSHESVKRVVNCAIYSNISCLRYHWREKPSSMTHGSTCHSWSSVVSCPWRS